MTEERGESTLQTLDPWEEEYLCLRVSLSTKIVVGRVGGENVLFSTTYTLTSCRVWVPSSTLLSP